MRAALILVVLLVIAGCASQTSYRRLPSRYADLSSSPAGESYLIGIVQAFGPPWAMRFDFNRSDDSVSVQIFDSDGPRPSQKKTGEEAARLLSLFRNFDWNALGEEGPPVLYADDAVVTLKARKAGVYREASGGAAEHPSLSALLKSVGEILKEPNQVSGPPSRLAPGRGSS